MNIETSSIYLEILLMYIVANRIGWKDMGRDTDNMRNYLHKISSHAHRRMRMIYDNPMTNNTLAHGVIWVYSAVQNICENMTTHHIYADVQTIMPRLTIVRRRYEKRWWLCSFDCHMYMVTFAKMRHNIHIMARNGLIHITKLQAKRMNFTTRS